MSILTVLSKIYKRLGAMIKTHVTPGTSFSLLHPIISHTSVDWQVKLWNMMSGFCFVTFNEHSSAVTDVIFTPNSQVVLSCSLDGTVRAFDLNRYGPEIVRIIYYLVCVGTSLFQEIPNVSYR